MGKALCLGHFARHAHSGGGGAGSRQGFAGHRPAEGPHQGREHTAAARDAGHGGAAVAEQIGGFAVGQHVDGPGHGHDGPGLARQRPGCVHGLGQGLLGDAVGLAHVHAAAARVVSGQRPDLRRIAPDDRKADVFQQPGGFAPPQGGVARAHGVEHHGPARVVGRLPAEDHGLHFIDGSQIADQRSGSGGGLCHLPGVGGHGGRAAHRQQDIGAVVHRDHICDAVHQRRALPDQREGRSKIHGKRPPIETEPRLSTRLCKYFDPEHL